MKKKAALLLDNWELSKWQSDALEAASDSIKIVTVLNCKNTSTKKYYFKNFLYYVLNVFSLRNYFTKKAQVNFSDIKVVDFYSLYSGAWQSFPKEIYEELESNNVDVVIKFGMSLLRLDEDRPIPPILSYHHGDPSKYRGRPAGFYEILNGEKLTGIIVQALNNKLDAGEIYAFAQSKVANFSYKKTSTNFYSNSAPLLNIAIINLFNNLPIEQRVNGKNYRLPSNFIVLLFLTVLIKNGIKKIVYGLFFEKRWKVAVTKNSLEMKKDEVLSSQEFNEIPINKRYNFYADPFFSEDGSKIRLEALDNKSGLGDILEIDNTDFTKQIPIMSGKHFSYPFSFKYEDKEYLLPEVASHSAQYFSEADDMSSQKYYLKGLEDKRIVDATLFLKDGKSYLFFGESQSALTILNLWVSNSPFSVFKPHPRSPVTISPSDARMGGRLLIHGKKLLRFGQNNSGEYGESLSIKEITNLSDEGYKEIDIGKISIDDFIGPHSIGFNNDKSEVLIDYYTNEFSFFAGIKRIKAIFKKEKS